MQLPNQAPKALWAERDMQKQRVYGAETIAWRNHPDNKVDLPEVEDVAREIKRVVNSRRVWKKFPFMSPKALVIGAKITDTYRITDGRGCRSASANTIELTFPRHSRKRWIVLHEVAHLLHGREQRAIRNNKVPPVDAEVLTPTLFMRKGYTSAHGWRYCMIYLQLVRWFFGKTEYDALRKAFKEQRVRYRPPRVMTPEQRAAAAERLKKIRVNAEFFRRAA